jgi:hypothetical protein
MLMERCPVALTAGSLLWGVSGEKSTTNTLYNQIMYYIYTNNFFLWPLNCDEKEIGKDNV